MYYTYSLVCIILCDVLINYLLQDTDLLGHIHMEEMMSAARCEDELSKDPRYQHCFEVNTQGRGYLFCADSEAEMDEWIKVFGQIINTSDAAENLVRQSVVYRNGLVVCHIIIHVVPAAPLCCFKC